MATINDAKTLILEANSVASAEAGFAFAEAAGYSDAEEFFSLAMSRILYSDDQIARGERYAVEPGSLDAEPLDAKQISKLQSEAGEAGDLAMVEICDRALAGDAAAISECARVIHDAKAQNA